MNKVPEEVRVTLAHIVPGFQGDVRERGRGDNCVELLHTHEGNIAGWTCVDVLKKLRWSHRAQSSQSLTDFIDRWTISSSTKHAVHGNNGKQLDCALCWPTRERNHLSFHLITLRFLLCTAEHDQRPTKPVIG